MRRAERAAADERERKRRKSCGVDGAPPLPPVPPLPPPHLDDLDATLASFGSTQGAAGRTFRFYARMEKLGVSEADAPGLIAEQQMDTRGAPRALELDARKGLAPPRAKVDALAAELGLNFTKHELSVSVAGVPPVVVPVYLRSLRGVARWHFRHLTPAHCTPRIARDADGARLYAEPMSCEWAHEQHARMLALDPSGVMLPLALASDKTELCNEQSAEPVYVVSNALPLHERRQRKFWLAVAYFGSLPARLVATISAAKATELRKALLRAAIVALFDAYRNGYASNPALLGERFVDAHGADHHVYVRFQNMIFDYPVVAAWTMTLQGSACFCCRRRAGEFHLCGPKSQARTVASERALVQAAFNAHPNSATARATYLRPFGLVAEFSPLDELAPLGLDRFSGITFSLLHMIYEGIWKVFLERTFAMIKAQVSTAEFNQLGARIDTWIVASVAPMPFIKTAFHTGISRYFHSAMKGEGWEAEIAFGKITSKDTYRDIMRFWRVLLFDLMPEAPQVQELFTDYLEWVRLALRLAHTDASLAHLDTYCEAWLDGAVRVMGKETLWNRIKAHAPTHLAEMIRRHASALFNDDSLGETAHIEGAKEPWDHTNHREVDAQLAKYVTRRDVLRLLRELDQRHRDARQPVAAAAAAAAAQPLAAPLPPSNALMTQKPARYLELAEASRQHAQLEQLTFALRLYLHLGNGGAEHSHLRDMQQPDEPRVQLYPGVRLADCKDEPRVALGGHKVKGNVLLDPSRLAMVAVKSKLAATAANPNPGYVIWYGQLVLCFTVHYLQRRHQLCYVRWLDRPEVVTKTIASVEKRRLLPAEETELARLRDAPFNAYRWSRATGSTRTGHPRAGAAHYGVVDARHLLYVAPVVRSARDAPDAPDPVFFLNTDMWDL